jgi:hypothetical protein
MVTAVPRWAYNNKFKTLALLILIYVARKAWIMYQTYVKPFLDIAKSLKGGGSTEQG